VNRPFLISCGGTGGHLAPGIAVAERLLGEGGACSLLVSQKQVDARLGEAYPHLNFIRVPGSPLGWSPAAFTRFAWSSARGVVAAHRLLHEFRPAGVIAFGGFLTLPIALACSLHDVPLALHEANRRPGRAIRWASRFAERLYLPEGVRIPNVPRARLRYPGYPLRREIRRQQAESARRKLGLDPAAKVLVILGDSQSAAALNQWVNRHLDTLGNEGVSIYCLTGLGKGSAGRIERRQPDGRRVTAQFVQFTDQMATVLSAADLVISRAGAGSIAELIACQVPSILVPYPHAADQHQLANARFLEQQGGALVLEEAGLDSLLSEVRELLFNDWLLGRLRQNLARLHGRDPAEIIVRDLFQLAREAELRALGTREVVA